MSLANIIGMPYWCKFQIGTQKYCVDHVMDEDFLCIYSEQKDPMLCPVYKKKKTSITLGDIIKGELPDRSKKE